MNITKNHIHLIFNKYKKCWIQRMLQKRYPKLYARIYSQTSFLDECGQTPTFFERLFCIEHSIYEKKKCEVCMAEYVKFNDKKYEYHKWCSKSCQASDPRCVAMSKTTRKTKYGDENYHGVDKARITREAKNGGKWHADDFEQKVKARKKINGHDENWNNTEKHAKTIAEKLQDNPNFWRDRELKSKQTKIQNGHDPNWNNRKKFIETLFEFTPEQKKHKSDALKASYAAMSDDDKLIKFEKIKDACISEYGCFPVTNCPEIKNEIKEHNIRQYGVEYYFQTEACKAAARHAAFSKTYDHLMQNEFDRPMFTIDELSCRTTDRYYEYTFSCLSCGEEFTSCVGRYDGIHRRCPKCFPELPHGTSHAEDDICKFIKTKTGLTVKTRTRKVIKPYELDMFIPEKNMAIEYNGLFWHSDAAPGDYDKNYHLTKTDLCEKAGIRLIHIFEDEWLEKQPIVMSRLLNLFGEHANTVFARKCNVRCVSPADASEFLNDNHIQGNVNSSIRLGLYFNECLIALMTFGKCRFDKKHEWEMLRFCTKLGYHIPGGAGKLLAYFERTYSPRSLVSYADRRWSKGELYLALGFKLDHISKPDYWYFNSTIHRYSRIMFQKHKLKNILKNFDPLKSEIENMKANGWKRIFDCGNYVFTKTYIK